MTSKREITNLPLYGHVEAALIVRQQLQVPHHVPHFEGAADLPGDETVEDGEQAERHEGVHCGRDPEVHVVHELGVVCLVLKPRERWSVTYCSSPVNREES